MNERLKLGHIHDAIFVWKGVSLWVYIYIYIYI